MIIGSFLITPRQRFNDISQRRHYHLSVWHYPDNVAAV